MTEDHPDSARGEVVLDLNFVPTWARKPSNENPYATFQGGRGDDRGGRDDRGDRRGRGGSGRGGFGDRDGGGFRDRRDRRDRRDGFGGRPKPGAHDDTRPAGAPDLRAPGAAAPAGGERPGQYAGGGGRDYRYGARPAPPPVDVAFLPERHRLGVAAHKIHVTRRAYPLAQLAELFLSKPEFYLVKVELARSYHRPAPSAPPPAATAASAAAPSAPAGEHRPADTGPRLYECKECHVLFLRKEAAVAHAASKHLASLFEVEEQTVETPSGNFKCVARCPRSGRILGPPNHHGFNEVLMEIHAELFAGVPLDEYRGNLEMVHDEALIEQWKQEYSKRKVYKLKAEPDRPPMRWIEARTLLHQSLAPAMIKDEHRAVIPATAAAEMEDPAIQRAIREAWTREDRFPMSLMIALRPALRHMGLHFFKAGGNISFITSVAPTAVDPDHAIAPIRDALNYLGDHPGVTREQMLAELHPGKAGDDPAVIEMFGHLRWLVDKGHVIEFFNGTLSVPRGRQSRAKTGGDTAVEGPAPEAAPASDAGIVAPAEAGPAVEGQPSGDPAKAPDAASAAE